MLPEVSLVISSRGVINGKAGKSAALPNFLDTLTLSQPCTTLFLKGMDFIIVL
jgi:hypothetical protein